MPETQQPQLSQQEATVAQAAVVESFVKQSTPEMADSGLEGTDKKRATDLADTLKNKYDPSHPLEGLRHRKNESALSRMDTETHLKQHIGTEGTPLTDENGEKTETGKLFDSAQETVDKVKQLEEKGLESFLKDEQKKLVGDVVARVIKDRPAFAGLTPGEKSDLARMMLKDKDCVGMIADTLKGRLELPVDEKLAQTIEAARKKVEGTQREIDKTGGDISRMGQQIDAAKNRQGIVDGRIEELEESKDEDKAESERLQIELRNICGESTSDQFKALQMSTEKKLEQGEELDENERTMMNYLEKQRILAELPKLRGERKQLPGQIDKLTEEQEQLKGNRDDLEYTKAGDQRKLDRELDKKHAQEKKFVKDLESSLTDGTDAWFDKVIDEREEAAVAALVKKAEAAATHDEKAFLQTLQERLYKVKEKRGKAKKTMNKRNIREDSAKLFAKGPDGLMDKLIDETFSKDEDKTRFRERLQSDPEFAKNMRAEAVQQVLVARIKSGPLYKNETLLLQEQEWGKQAIDKAITAAKKTKVDADALLTTTGSASTYESLRHYSGADNAPIPVKAAIWSLRWAFSPTFLPEAIKWGVEKFQKNQQLGREYPRPQ
jgi:hypothetical protein